MEIWERVIERFGLPLAGLIGMVWFFNRTLWPFLKERIAAAEKALSDQVAEAREARREDQKEFLAALARRDEKMGEQTDAFRQLTQKIDEQKGPRSHGR